MLNPFLQPTPVIKKQRRSTAAAEEAAAQLYGHSVDTASPRPNMGLWVGRLLIRMGERLTRHESDLKDLKENA